MTTDLQEAESLQLPWNYFLQKNDSSDTAIAMIDGWRRTEWKSIQRLLFQEYRWELPDGLEPHWVRPGKAVYWHDQLVRVRRFVDNKSGNVIPHTVANLEKGHWEADWNPVGGVPTGPLPANNASQLAHYLNKGFRLRPPKKGVAAEMQRESADLPEVVSESLSTAVYFCRRHEKGVLGFSTWDAYLKHCAHNQEAVTEAPPQEVLSRINRFKWYCPLHDIGFNHPNHAQRHYKTERRKPGGQYHPTVEDMLVKKDGVTV